MESYETVIVGAGPAGLRCAEILAQNGKEVLVLEKGKVIGDKVCGGLLSLNDLELGIPNKIIQKKYKKITIRTPFKDTEVKLDKSFLATIDRKDLGKWMFDKTKKAGAEIRIKSAVTKINDKFIVVNDKKIKYKYLIGADGANSIVRKHLNVKTDKFLEAFHYICNRKTKDFEIIVDPDKFGPGYLWVFPYKNTTSIGTGGDVIKKLNKPVFNLKICDIRKNLDGWCKKKKINTKKAKFQAAMINYDYKGHKFGNKFLIGDAGGFASGLTGEGIYFAIKSGEEIAKKIIDKKYNCPYIKHMIKVKKLEEGFLRTLEKNKLFSKIEWGLLNTLFEIKWLDKKIVKKVD
ncbi:NAD(P)/FAD-dependent oxidoreductase [Nanoarchaeota archaeon]